MWLAAQSVSDSSGWLAAALFWLFAGLCGVSAWSVVLCKSIVRMAVYLMLTLAGVAGIYFLLGAELLAAVQLIVYVGGVLILIVFGVMLTNRNPTLNIVPRGVELLLGLAIACIIAALLAIAGLASSLPQATLVGPAVGEEHGVRHVGHLLLSRHLVVFELAAVILLVVMVGAGYLVRRKAVTASGANRATPRRDV